MLRYTSVLVILCLFNPQQLRAQRKSSELDSSASRIRNFVFITPVSRNTTINGLAIGLMPSTRGRATKLKINGVSVHASPFDILYAMYGLAFSVHSLTGSKRDTARIKDGIPLANRYVYPQKDTIRHVIQNGLFIGGANDGNKINGLNISIVGNAGDVMNGLSISGFFNVHHTFNGLLIGGLRNKTTTGTGLQVGLFNSCQSGKLLQIGLINRIGKRVIPIINFSF